MQEAYSSVQRDLRDKLHAMISEERYPHALMLSGDMGYGGMPIALDMAKHLMCRNPEENRACGACEQCIKNRDFQNPDLLLSFPTVSQNGPTTSADFYPAFLDFILENPFGGIADWLEVIDAEKKQANITAKECRRVIDRLSLKSVSSDAKVLIMWLPEFLGKEGNILLKQIEEPTSGTFMIFVTADPNAILGTIRSRVQDIRIPPIHDMELRETTEKLLPSFAADVEDYRLFEGNWSNVLEASRPTDRDVDELLKGYLNAIFTQSIDVQMDWIATMENQNKNEQIQFLQYLLTTLYKLLRSEQYPNDRIITKLKTYNLSIPQIDEWMSILEDIKYSLKRNVQSKLLFYNLVLRSQYMLKNYSIH